MKDKASVSHDESMARELRENPDFAAEYLRAAMEDEAEQGRPVIGMSYLGPRPLYGHRWHVAWDFDRDHRPIVV